VREVAERVGRGVLLPCHPCSSPTTPPGCALRLAYHPTRVCTAPRLPPHQGAHCSSPTTLPAPPLQPPLLLPHPHQHALLPRCRGCRSAVTAPISEIVSPALPPPPCATAPAPTRTFKNKLRPRCHGARADALPPRCRGCSSTVTALICEIVSLVPSPSPYASPHASTSTYKNKLRPRCQMGQVLDCARAASAVACPLLLRVRIVFFLCYLHTHSFILH
jgi:hypothetical protein